MENELDKAFEALKAFDWGKDTKPLAVIDAAVVASHGNAEDRKKLAARLAESLKTSPSRGAKDYICRKLTIVGTADSVPALAALLADKDNSHMARYALEQIPAPEAAAALRDALPQVSGSLKVGVIGSIGARRDADSVAALAGLLGDADKKVADAAACALGDIASPEAAKALSDSLAKSAENVAMTDACLVCAERLLVAGKKADAVALYKLLGKTAKSKRVRLAATRGLLDASKAKK